MIKIIGLIILLTLSLSCILLAENDKEYWSKQLQEFRNDEKVHISVEQALQILNSGKFHKNKKNESKEIIQNEKLQSESTETLISYSDAPESEVYAAINPKDSNNIVISPIRQDMTMSYSITCPVYYTKDFGKTWNKSSFITSPLYDSVMLAGGGDPMFTFDKNGRLYFSWINEYYRYINQGSESNPYYSIDSVFEAMFYAYSDDGGANFQFDNTQYVGEGIAGFEYSTSQYNSFKFFLDKQWMASDRSNSQYSGSVYTSSVRMDYITGDTEILLYRKHPGQNKFSKDIISVNNNFGVTNQFVNLDVSNDGSVHSTYFVVDNSNTYGLYHAVSTDGGNSFSSSNLISNFKGSYGSTSQKLKVTGISSSRMYPAPHLAIDKSSGEFSGNLYFTWSAGGINSLTSTGMDVYFSRSTDNGTNWTTPIVINPDFYQNSKNNSFYSNITVSPEGVVIVGYYLQDVSITTAPTNYYLAFSYNGGKSFDRFVKVTSQSTNFSTIGNQNQKFGIGEYNAVLTSLGYAMPVWGDGRTQDGNLNIYMAKVPMYGSTGVEELISVNDNMKELFSVSPNPANELITIGFNQQVINDANIVITDLKGSVVKEYQSVSLNNNFQINISDLYSGVYLIDIRNKDYHAAKQFVKAR